MNGNGDSVAAPLAARVAELEAALQILTRRWEEELVPRLVEIEQDVDLIAAQLARRSE